MFMMFFLFNVLTFVILVELHYYSVVIRIDNIAVVTPLHASGHYDVINSQWMLNAALTAPHNVPDQNYLLHKLITEWLPCLQIS